MDGEQLRGLTEIYSMEAFLGQKKIKRNDPELRNVCLEMHGFFDDDMCDFLDLNVILC